MRCNNRLAGDRERVVEGLVGDMGNVDDHPDAVHLPDYLAPEIGQAVVLGFVRGRIGPVGVAEVRQGHGADTQSLIYTEYCKVVVDGVAALDREDSCNLASFSDPLDIGRAQCELDLIWMRVKN